MPYQQQKITTRRQDTSKHGDANAAKANNTHDGASASSPGGANVDTETPSQADKMAKDISSIYALLRETSESQDTKLNAIQSATRAVEAKLSDIATRLSDVESRIDFLEDANKTLEENPPATKSEVELLRQKLDDLENRNRRNNLRFVGFPEGCEGQDAATFLSDAIPQLLNIDFPRGLDIDRAHRALTRRKPDDQPPRAIVARFLRFQDRERIMEAARRLGKLSWDGHRVMIFPDYSKPVTEKRAAFNQCKQLLHERKVKFSLMYPAVLTLMTAEGRRQFTEPKKALDYIRSMPRDK